MLGTMDIVIIKTFYIKTIIIFDTSPEETSHEKYLGLHELYLQYNGRSVIVADG